VIGLLSHAIELDPNLPCAYQGLSQAIIFTGDIAQAVTLARRSVELGPSDADNLLFLAVALLQQGEVAEAETIVEKAYDLNPLRPPYYPFFHAMILWGAERYAEALEECEECLRKAPGFRGAEVYRVMALVGLGRLDEAKARWAEYISRPEIPLQPPHAPALASRCLTQLRAAGWRPALTAAREAG
jgi:tetratricopeptide (TPR) repeat protein